jgi:hypothetical protein
VRITQLLIIALIAVACGGDDDAGTGDTQPADSNTTTSSTTTSPTTTSPPDDSPPAGSGSDTEFCEYLRAFDEQTDQAPALTNPGDVQMLFEDVADSLARARDLAPSEIADDVDLLADTYDGFIEVLKENDYNFLAMVPAIETDPRLIAMDSEEVERAGDNIATFCGLPNFGDDDEFDAGPPTTGSFDPGTIASSDELPADFPSNLEPPGVTEVEALVLPAGFSVNIFSSASFEDLVAFYTGELGDPMAVLDAPDQSALWITGTLAVSVVNEGDSRLVNVTRTG